ncbi:MAG: alpha/beta fold hydrolase [Jatrophihabitans sp.]
MRIGTLPVIGGAVGLLGAAAAAGVAQQRRTAVRDRARIDPKSAAGLGSAPVDRQRVLHTGDGLRLHTEEVGAPDAPLTVLYVHGYTLHLGSFDFQRRTLAAEFDGRLRQVLFDLRSHGRSEHSPAEDCTIEQLGRDLHQVIEQLVPTGPLVLVGHSMGGMTVMALASQQPELFAAGGRVRGVALINTSSGDLRNLSLGLPGALARLPAAVLPLVLRRAARSARLVERGRALGKDLAWAMTKRLSFADPAVDPAVVAYCTNMIAATPVTVVAEFFPTLMAHDGRLGLRNLTGCPVLVVGADHDALTPVEHSERIAQALPAAKLVVAPMSGHLLMLEHPELVNAPLRDLVASALAGVKPGRASGRPAAGRR